MGVGAAHRPKKGSLNLFLFYRLCLWWFWLGLFWLLGEPLPPHFREFRLALRAFVRLAVHVLDWLFDLRWWLLDLLFERLRWFVPFWWRRVERAYLQRMLVPHGRLD